MTDNIFKILELLILLVKIQYIVGGFFVINVTKYSMMFLKRFLFFLKIPKLF